jgi:hypothetical protein
VVRRIVLVAVITVAVWDPFGIGLTMTRTATYTRAFSSTSFYNLPIPADAQVDPSSDSWIGSLTSFGDPAYPKLVLGPALAMPFYVSGATDPLYTITVGKHTVQVHIPKGATPMTAPDGAMTIHDTALGIWVGLHQAVYLNGKWTANGMDRYSDASNGLDGSLPDSTDPLNFGHRGMSSALSFVPKSEIDAGVIDHVLKVSVDLTGPNHTYPATGDEGYSGTIWEGLILRIRPEVNLSTLGLSKPALVIATAMQTYGLIIGDTGDTPCALKLERDADWTGVLNAKSLSKLNWSMFDFVLAGSHR